MHTELCPQRLQQENALHAGSGGCSAGNAGCGFRPAFYDAATRRTYLSCFADGRPAPFHLLDGLPDEVVLSRRPDGRPLCARASLISGFERAGRFYSREEAARAVAAG